MVLQVTWSLSHGIVEMAGANGIFGEDEGVGVGVPDGEGPVADELGEAVGSPLVVGGGDDGDVGGVDGESRRGDCRMSSARLSRRPSQVMTAPDLVT